MPLRQISNTCRASKALFCARHKCALRASGIVAFTGRGENRHGNFRERADHTTVVRFGCRGMPRATVREMPDFDAWLAWLRSLDTAWLFFLVLAVAPRGGGAWGGTP